MADTHTYTHTHIHTHTHTHTHTHARVARARCTKNHDNKDFERSYVMHIVLVQESKY